MSDLKTQINAAIQTLITISASLEDMPAGSLDKPVVTEPTPEMIGENVAGNPNLYKDNPGLYAKMAKFYNPAKQPFTSDTWMTTGLLGFGSKKPLADGTMADVRPYKIVDRDGEPWQRSNKQAGPAWYWISKGVRDITAKEWNKLDIKHDISVEEQAENVRKYKGGIPPGGVVFPSYLAAAWKENHK